MPPYNLFLAGFSHLEPLCGRDRSLDPPPTTSRSPPPRTFEMQQRGYFLFQGRPDFLCLFWPWKLLAVVHFWWISPDSSLVEGCYWLWQYRLWSFRGRDTKLESFLAKNQHTQRIFPFSRPAGLPLSFLALKIAGTFVEFWREGYKIRKVFG